MKVTLTLRKEFDVKTLKVEAEPRYWEDADVDGVEDTEGTLIPCREGDLWKPLIDIESGVITNWEKGKTAKIHYKVCDAGMYYILDESGDVVAEKEGYVPDIMCPERGGYGDYIIMNVDAAGKIDKWKPEFSEFEETED